MSRADVRFREHLRHFRADVSIEDAVMPPKDPFQDIQAAFQGEDVYGWMEALLGPQPPPRTGPKPPRPGPGPGPKPVTEAVDSVEPPVRAVLDDLDNALTSGRKELQAMFKKLKALAGTSKRSEDIGAFLAIVQETWALMGALQKTAQDEFPARAQSKAA